MDRERNFSDARDAAYAKLCASHMSLVESDLTNALFRSLCEAAPTIVRSSNWLTGLVAATLALVVSNLAELRSLYSPPSLTWAMALLLTGGIIGALVYWQGLGVVVRATMALTIESQMAQVHQTHSDAEQQIEEIAAQIGRVPDLDPDMRRVMEPILRALWWPRRMRLQRQLDSAEGAPWNSYQDVVRAAQFHGLLVLIQFVVTASAFVVLIGACNF
jgi:hypothetical protein